MFLNASEIKGYAIAASDGRLGTVSDFLFDDESWLVRWLVVDTGNWLSGRKVLLPPSVLGHRHPTGEEFPVELTMQQVKDSPEIDTDQSVSRQMESKVYNYYGWSPYWGAGYLGGAGYVGGSGAVSGVDYIGGLGLASPFLGSARREEPGAAARNDGDPHLRSTVAVTGYHIHASDGEIGHVDEFLIDDADWSIRYLVVDTKNWWPGKKVLISPRSIHEIDWTDKLVNLDVNRQKVKDSPAYDASIRVEKGYDEKFLTYYGIKFAEK